MKIPSLTATAAAFLLATTVTTTGASGSLTPRSWEEALTMANTLVDKMSLEQKVNITTGAGYEKTLCVGQTGSTTNPDFPSLCLQDGPLGVRIAHNVTAGLSGITASQSWDKEALRKRGEYMGKEVIQWNFTLANRLLTCAADNSSEKRALISSSALMSKLCDLLSRVASLRVSVKIRISAVLRVWRPQSVSKAKEWYVFQYHFLSTDLSNSISDCYRKTLHSQQPRTQPYECRFH